MHLFGPLGWFFGYEGLIYCGTFQVFKLK